MKVICFIVVLIEIMKEVHSFTCYVHKDDELPKDLKYCEPGEMCSYEMKKVNPIEIYRGCIPKHEVDWKLGKCLSNDYVTKCACDTENCNYDCSADKCSNQEPDDGTVRCCDVEIGGPGGHCTAMQCGTAAGGGPEKNDTTTTDATATNKTKTNPTDDNARSTKDDGPQPTEDSSGATGEDGPQPTEDSSGATSEDGPQPTEDGTGTTGEDGPQPTEDSPEPQQKMLKKHKKLPPIVEI